MRTVRARLTGFTIVVVALILGLMGFFVRFRVHSNLISEIDRELQADISTVKTDPSDVDSLPVEAHPQPVPFSIAESGSEARENRMIQILRSQKGAVRLEAKWKAPRLIPVKDAGPDSPARADDPEGLRGAIHGPFFHDYGSGEDAGRSLTAPVRNGSETVAYVQALRPLAPVHRQLADLDRALATSIPFAVLMAALSGALLVGSAMRPLRRMNEAARRLDRDLSSARLPAEGQDEFGELATSINVAFDRTAAAFAEQRRALAQLERFTGDAGHELRTPLASIKTNSSFLLHIADVPAEHRPPLEVIDTCADRMTKLIADLLLLAQQDGTQPTLKPIDVDLRNLIEEVVDALASEGGPTVQITSVSPITVRVDRDAVERVLLNLVSNALRYARTTVTIAATVSGDDLALEVRDDGPGIAPEDVARLGERFFRPDESRSRHQGGVGLGLAIARSLAESHAGDLRIGSVLGEGTIARARLRIENPPC